METILVVDDDDLVREILAIRFGNLGFRCLEASNGEASLALLETTPVHCIVLDTMMPMLSGPEMVMRLRANPAWSGIPVVMLTHCASIEERRRALALGAAAFLAKPFTLDDVVAQVRTVIAERPKQPVRRLKVTVMGSVALSAALPGAALAHATEPAPAPVAATVPAKAPAGTPTAAPADPPPSDIPAPDPAAQTPSPRIDPLPGTPDAAEERPPTYSVALIQGFSGANGNRTPGGRETSAVLTYADGRGTGYTVQVDHARRFGATDTSLLAQIDRRLGDRVGGYLGLSATPDADFRERWGVRGGLTGGVARGVEVLLDSRLAEYGDGVKLAATPSVTVTGARERWSFNAGYISLWSLTGIDEGSRRDGFTTRLTVRPSDKTSFLAGLARYPEVETTIARTVTSRFVGASHAIAPRLRLSASYANDRYAQLFTRHTVTVGLSFRLDKPG